ncbi:phage tail protein [Streptococcus constellatus]|uniref:phage tail protein n=1 Tax=Streptococcus constellatus TaxID=76860 RepID=UPI0028E51144|nr:phage tail protein [Streptococcus constellatus]
MLLTIHDAHLRQVASIDNDKQGTLNYFNDTWTSYLETGAATFDFTVSKKELATDTYSKRAYQFLNEKNFISFEYEGETQLFIVRKVVENEKLIKLNCVNLNLELINEYANPYKALKDMSFEEYCKALDLLNFTMLKIGVNEISDKKLTLEWEGQETKLARLLSLANKFGAEIEFKTFLNSNSSIKAFVVNVYHANDGFHQGVGKRQSKVLRYGRDFNSLTRTVDTTGIYNAILPTGNRTEVTSTKTSVIHNVDGSVTTTKKVRNPDGSVTTISKRVRNDGFVLGQVVTKTVKNPDGTSSTTTEREMTTVYKKRTGRRKKAEEQPPFKVKHSKTSKTSAYSNDSTFDLADLPDWKLENENGQVEFYKAGKMLYAPLSMQMFPAAFTSDTMNDQWIRRDATIDAETQEELSDKALDMLRKSCYPAVTYEVDGYLPYGVGDTVEIEDDGFALTLLLEMRVSERSISFTGTGTNKSIFANFKALENQLSSGIQQRLEEMLEEAKPYDIKIASDNGTVFKNNKGKSTIYPTLLKGGKTIPDSEVGWKWKLDEREFPLAPTFTIEAAGITKPLTLTVIAIINGKEVAQKELPFTNVNDGAKGSDGKSITVSKAEKQSDGVKVTFSDNKSIVVPKGENGSSLRLFTTNYRYNQADIKQYSADGYTGVWVVNENTAGVKAGDSVQMRVFNTDKNSNSWIIASVESVNSANGIKTVSKGLIDKGDKGDPADPAPLNALEQEMRQTKQGLSDVKTDLLKEKSESSAKIDQVKKYVGVISSQQTAYEQSNKQNLARITQQMADKANKTEVKQTVDGIREEISQIVVGGRNLLKGSKGEFKPDSKPTGFDNQVLYVQSTSIDLVKGEKYLISAKTDGNFTAMHNSNKESDNVVLWLMDKTVTNYQIVSNSNTGTTGTVFAWNKPTGTYHLRVNTYHKDARKKVWEVKVEQGTIKTDWSPAPEDVDEQIAVAKTTLEKTAEGLKTDMVAVKSYVANDGKRREELEKYSREETAKQIAAERIKTAENYVGKSQYTEDVKGVNRRFEELSIGGNNLLAYSNFNKNGYYQNGLKSDANYIYSNLIKLQGTDYCLQVWELKTISKQNWVGVQFFDDVNKPAANGYSTFWFNGHLKQLLKAPNTAKYIAISLDKRALNQDEIKFKLELGNIPSDWSPAPEDTNTKLAEYKQGVDGQLAAVKQEVGSKVSQTTFDQRANQITQSVQELSNNTFKKNQIKINENGLVSSSEKTVNGQTLASMISQNPEWVEIIAKLLKIKADMIVNGAITADKLNIKELSALSSDLGEVSAGLINLQKHLEHVRSEDVWGTIENITCDKGTILSDTGIVSNGFPIRKAKGDVKPTVMPLVWLNSGELYFTNVDSEYDLIQIMLNGVYPFTRTGSGRIHFGKMEDGRDALYVDCGFSELYLKANNYTDWKQSTFNPGVRWKVQGNLVLVDYDVAFNKDGTQAICSVPQEYVAGARMFVVKAWSLNKDKDRTAQLNAGGDLHILGAEKGMNYRGQIIWTY